MAKFEILKFFEKLHAGAGFPALPVTGEDDAQVDISKPTGDADWQLVAYGNTVHAFTNARYQEPGGAALFSPSVDRRSWQTLTDFLAELFPS